MGAFFLVQRNVANSQFLLKQARTHIEDQGFCSPVIVSTKNYELYLYGKLMVSTENYVTRPGSDFCACTGTLLYSGLVGEDALARFYDDFQSDNVPQEGLYGAFCIIIRKEGKTFLFVDRLGVYKTYRNESGTVWSSSFLCISGALTKRTIDKQSVYEYVFQGATYGNRTIFNEAQLVSSEFVYELADNVKKVQRERLLDRVEVNPSLDACVHESLKQLRDYYQVIAGCFGDKTDTALSGGYDSRLTLGLLFEQGVNPSVHVYGRENDLDVRVARNISRGEGFDLEHKDKSHFPKVGKNNFSGVVKANFLAFDGYPTDGIFDSGVDLSTRRERCVEGRLMINGGGGEVFRNFFYLPNRSFTARQLLWTFYSRFDPNTCTALFDEHVYHNALESKLKAALGVTEERLTRQDVEKAYPLFRCRYWMGRNNSVNNRFGYALTPFIDSAIVKSAITIPLQEKYFGRFEARLIREVSPALAAYVSDYGHDFSGDLPRSKIIKELLTYARPPWLRRYTYRVQNRLSKEILPYTLSKGYLGDVLNGMPHMNMFFNVERVKDSAQYNRICTLEYLLQRFSADFTS